MASINLYVDDVRTPPGGWLLARSYDEAVALLDRLDWRVDVLSLDHDIGEGRSGYDLLCQVEQRAAEGLPIPAELHVHSANPVGVDRMLAAIRSIETIVRSRTGKESGE